MAVLTHGLVVTDRIVSRIRDAVLIAIPKWRRIETFRECGSVGPDLAA